MKGKKAGRITSTFIFIFLLSGIVFSVSCSSKSEKGTKFIQFYDPQ